MLPGSTMLPGSSIRVVAAVLYDALGRVLIAQRPAGKAMAGLWEFPGGKLEAGEGELEALRRELQEELGVRVDSARAVLELTHDYPDRQVRLSVWAVSGYEGVPAGIEDQVLRWVAPTELRALPLLPADQPIVDFLEDAYQTSLRQAR